MNFRLTLALVTFLLVIACLFAFLKNRGPVSKADGPANAVLTPAPKDVTTITLTEEDAPRLAFAKTGEKWALTQPLKASVNSWEVDSIAGTLKGLTYKEKYQPEATGRRSLEETGLAKPRYAISFADSSAKQYKLLFGKRTASGAIMARLDGDTKNTIYVLSDNPLDKLDKDVNEFRAKELFEITTDQATELTIKSHNQKVLLAKSSTTPGKWLVQQPINSRANATAVEELLREFKGLKAESFTIIGRNEPATGLAAPVLTLSLGIPETSGNEGAKPAATTPAAAKLIISTVQFGNYTDLSKKNMYAAVGNGGSGDDVVLISAETFDKLNKQLKDLRDPVIIPTPVADATAVEFGGSSDNSGGIHLAKQAGEWQMTSASLKSPLPGEAAEVTKILEAMRDLRANKFMDAAGDLKTIGIDPPMKTIRLTIPGQSEQETLLLGKPQTAEPVTPVMRQGEPTVYLVQTPDLAKLAATLLDLRRRAVANFKPSDMLSISIQGPDAKAPVILVKEANAKGGNQWKYSTGGKSWDVEEEKISKLRGDLDPLTAQKWLRDTSRELNKEAPGNITLTLEITGTTPTGTQPVVAGPSPPQKVLIVFHKLPDGSYQAYTDAGAAAPQWVFQPTAELVEHLTKVDYRPAAATQPATAPATGTTPDTLP